MKQVTQRLKDGRVEVLDVPAPSLRAHGAIVRTAWSLISAGTERAKVDLGEKSLIGKARSRPDQVKQVVDKVRRDGLLSTYRTVMTRLQERTPIGYSLAGTVVEVGDLADGVSPGERVACGGGEYASHAEIVYVPATLCARVPENVDLDEAAFAAVGAVALQGVRQSGVTLGDSVAVVGLGLVGQLTVQMLRAAGCQVAGVDIDASRCGIAERFGAEKTAVGVGPAVTAELSAFGGDRGLDAVIVTAAARDSGPIELAGALARDRGVVVVVGDVKMEVPRALFYEKELVLKLSRSYGPGRYDPTYEELAIDYPVGYVRWTEQRNMAEFLRLLSEKSIDVKPLITHRFAIDDAADAYEVVKSPSTGSLAVLLEYPEQREKPQSMEVCSAPAVAPPDGSTTVGMSLVGAGNFATATLLPALMHDARVVRRGVHTLTGLSARDVADRFRFEYCAATVDELLRDEHTQAVVLATRHDSHAELAVKAMRAGKTVFVEKPLALTEEQLEAVVAAQRATLGKLTVGFNRRFSPLVRRVVAELSQRTSPVVIAIRVNAGRIPSSHWTQLPEQGGGRIVGEMCHFIDLAACLAGQSPQTVFAASADLDKSPALTDSLTATLTFGDGSVATVTYVATGDTSYPKERVEVFCGGRVWAIDDFRSLTLAAGGKVRRVRLKSVDKGHREEMCAFVDLALGMRPSSLTFADCVASTAATFKVIESLSTGQHVAVPSVETDR